MSRDFFAGARPEAPPVDETVVCERHNAIVAGGACPWCSGSEPTRRTPDVEDEDLVQADALGREELRQRQREADSGHAIRGVERESPSGDADPSGDCPPHCPRTEREGATP